jgi:hypothetical protein
VRCHHSLQENLEFFKSHLDDGTNEGAFGWRDRSTNPPTHAPTTTAAATATATDTVATSAAHRSALQHASAASAAVNALCERAALTFSEAEGGGMVSASVVAVIAALDEADNLLFQVEPIALTLAKAGAAHDFSPEVRGNGFWSLCRVVTKAVGAVEAVSDQCRESRGSLFYTVDRTWCAHFLYAAHRALSHSIVCWSVQTVVWLCGCVRAPVHAHQVAFAFLTFETTHTLTLSGTAAATAQQLHEVAVDLIGAALRPLLVLALEYQTAAAGGTAAGLFVSGDAAVDLMQQTRFPERKHFFGRCIGWVSPRSSTRRAALHVDAHT